MSTLSGFTVGIQDHDGNTLFPNLDGVEGEVASCSNHVVPGTKLKIFLRFPRDVELYGAAGFRLTIAIGHDRAGKMSFNQAQTFWYDAAALPHARYFTYFRVWGVTTSDEPINVELQAPEPGDTRTINGTWWQNACVAQKGSIAIFLTRGTAIEHHHAGKSSRITEPPRVSQKNFSGIFPNIIRKTWVHRLEGDRGKTLIWEFRNVSSGQGEQNPLNSIRTQSQLDEDVRFDAVAIKAQELAKCKVGGEREAEKDFEESSQAEDNSKDVAPSDISEGNARDWWETKEQMTKRAQDEDMARVIEISMITAKAEEDKRLEAETEMAKVLDLIENRPEFYQASKSTAAKEEHERWFKKNNFELWEKHFKPASSQKPKKPVLVDGVEKDHWDQGIANSLSTVEKPEAKTPQEEDAKEMEEDKAKRIEGQDANHGEDEVAKKLAEEDLATNKLTRRFCDFTSGTFDQAQHFLDLTEGDLDQAVELFINHPELYLAHIPSASALTAANYQPETIDAPRLVGEDERVMRHGETDAEGLEEVQEPKDEDVILSSGDGDVAHRSLGHLSLEDDVVEVACEEVLKDEDLQGIEDDLSDGEGLQGIE